MGCAGGKLEEGDYDKHKEIEKELRRERDRITKEIKLLLLGTGEAGKSTFFKQMTLLYKNGFSKDEISFYKNVIFSNVFLGFRSLIDGAELLEIPIGDANKEYAEHLADLSAMTRFQVDPEEAKKLQSLFKDEGIQKAAAQRHRFQIMDSFFYFMENIERIGAPDYIPTDQDILHSRATTTGICEIQFVKEGLHFKIVDVGGQRGERVKWVHCFEDVVAILFFTALSEYNQSLFEDDNVNRVVESLKLFEDIINSKWFSETPVILFLNKSDLFKAKLAQYPINEYFPEYEGGADFDMAVDFFKDKFLALNRNPNKNIFTHVTCATDTENIKHVFNADWEGLRMIEETI